jgi:pyruvate/2-oxoglutarate dehydrogenase complex dihydrolipoamide acyltransferase (E2) component
LVTIGNIFEKSEWVDVKLELREYICLTLSFNHNIFDGANASGFTGCLLALVKSGTLLNELITQ